MKKFLTQTTLQTHQQGEKAQIALEEIFEPKTSDNKVLFNLLAFAAVLDQKLEEIAVRFDVPLQKVHDVCLLNRKQLTSNARVSASQTLLTIKA